MKLFKKSKKTETRNFSENSVDAQLRKALGVENLGRITFKQAMQIPAVCASVNFISEICARVPVKLYVDGEDGTTQEVTDDIRTRLLNDSTGDLLNPYQMKKAWVRDYFDGRGYIYINDYSEDGVSGKSLHYVEKNQISVIKNTHPIFKSADIFIADRKYYPFRFLRLCRNTKDGVTGESIIDTNGEILRLYYDTMQFEKLLMRTGGNKKGFIKSAKPLSEESVSKIRKVWDDLFNRNTNNMMILNDGMDFKETSATSTEMQLNENKTTNANDITMMFLLSSKALQGGSDDEIVAAVKTAVIPIISQMEAAYNDSLLLEDEKDTMYFSCDTSQIERGDILKRYRAYQIALQSNFMQPDEVRYKEDLSPLGLDFIKLGLNDVLYNPKTKEVYTPNTNQTAKIDGSSGQIEERKKSNFIQGKDGKMQGSYSTGGGGSALTKGGKSGKIKTDFNGEPYTYLELKLPKKEYGKVIREIDDLYYSKYEGKEQAVHRSGNSRYWFETRGFNDYNIYRKSKD